MGFCFTRSRGDMGVFAPSDRRYLPHLVGGEVINGLLVVIEGQITSLKDVANVVLRFSPVVTPTSSLELAKPCETPYGKVDLAVFCVIKITFEFEKGESFEKTNIGEEKF